MSFSEGTQVLFGDSVDLFKGKHNTLAEVVGDIELLDTLVTTSAVDAINALQGQLDDIVAGVFSLSNDEYLVAGANGGGTVNVLKVNTSNKIVFGIPIVTLDIQGGTITSLTSPVPVSAGGTGAITASAARSGLGVAIGTNVQAWDANLDQIAALGPLADNFMIGTGAAWVLKTPSEVRTILGSVIGTNVQAWDTNLDQIAALSPVNGSFVVGSGVGGTWGLRDESGVRAALSLIVGTNVQAWNSKLDQISGLVPTNGNVIIGESGIWVEKSPVNARSALGVTIGLNVQAWDLNLDQIAALTPVTNTFIAGNGSAWVTKTTTEVKTALDLIVGTHIQAWDVNLDQIAALSPTLDNFMLGTGSAWTLRTPSQIRTTLSLVIGSNVQAWDQNLDQIATLIPTANNFIIGDGSAWILATPSNARTALGLGTIATQAANSISITGGSISGTTIDYIDGSVTSADLHADAATRSCRLAHFHRSSVSGNLSVQLISRAGISNANMYMPKAGKVTHLIIQASNSRSAGSINLEFSIDNVSQTTVSLSTGFLVNQPVSFNFNANSSFAVNIAAFTFSPVVDIEFEVYGHFTV